MRPVEGLYKHPLLRWLPAVGIMILIFCISATPSYRIPSTGAWDVLVKKGSHFLGYALLGAACLYGTGRVERRTMAYALAISVLYALSDEYHQTFTPGRHGQLSDAGIDTLGAMLGVYLGARWQSRK